MSARYIDALLRADLEYSSKVPKDAPSDLS